MNWIECLCMPMISKKTFAHCGFPNVNLLDRKFLTCLPLMHHSCNRTIFLKTIEPSFLLDKFIWIHHLVSIKCTNPHLPRSIHRLYSHKRSGNHPKSSILIAFSIVIYWHTIWIWANFITTGSPVLPVSAGSSWFRYRGIIPKRPRFIGFLSSHDGWNHG